MIGKMLANPEAADVVAKVVAMVKGNIPPSMLVDLIMESDYRGTISFGVSMSEWPEVKAALLTAEVEKDGKKVQLLNAEEKKMLDKKEVEQWWEMFKREIIEAYNEG